MINPYVETQSHLLVLLTALHSSPNNNERSNAHNMRWEMRKTVHIHWGYFLVLRRWGGLVKGVVGDPRWCRL